MTSLGQYRPLQPDFRVGFHGCSDSKSEHMNFRRKIQEIVGSTYSYALFYNFPGGLRFELSEGASPLDQALSALRKATVVCNDVFTGEERILVHLQMYAPESRFRLRGMLREFKVAGVIVPKVRDAMLRF